MLAKELGTIKKDGLLTRAVTKRPVMETLQFNCLEDQTVAHKIPLVII